MDVEPSDDAAHGVEVPLAGGDVTDGVVRVGDTVRRPRGPWSSSVASYLQHLDQVGFPEAPRYLGIDERGRDILQFIPGDVPSQPLVEPWAAASSVLVGVADLLRRLHQSMSGPWEGWVYRKEAWVFRKVTRWRRLRWWLNVRYGRLRRQLGWHNPLADPDYD